MSIPEKNYRFYMQRALMQARVALTKQEVPIGAVVVDQNGTIIGRGYNAMEHKHSQSEHAEVRAIRQATKKHGDWRLDGCTIFVTLEPCLMCFGLIMLSRIAGVIYGANSPLFGAGLDKPEGFRLYKKDLLICSGVSEQESVELLQSFFQKRRKHKG